MKKQQWKLFMAGMLAAGMLSQPVSVFAGEPASDELQEQSVSTVEALADSGEVGKGTDPENNEKTDSSGSNATGSSDSNATSSSGSNATGSSGSNATSSSGSSTSSSSGSSTSSSSGSNTSSSSSSSGSSASSSSSSSAVDPNAQKAQEEEAAKEAAAKKAAEEAAAKKAAEEETAKKAAEEAAAKKAAEEEAAKKAAEEEAAKKTEEEEAAKKAAEEEAAKKAAEEEAAKKAEEEKKKREEEDKAKDDIERVLIGTGSRIVTKPDIQPSFRFWTVAKNKAFTKRTDSILEDKNEDARAVGTIRNIGVVYVLKDDGDGWLYVESGDARGFIRADNLYLDEEAQNIEKGILESAGAVTAEEKAKFDWSSREAEADLPVYENKAYTYTHTTTRSTVIDKLYFMVDVDKGNMLNVREDQSEDARVVGTLESGAIGYIIDDPGDSDWVYIESGEVRGFVARRFLRRDNLLQTEIVNKIEEAAPEGNSGSVSVKAAEAVYKTAKATVKPAENKALYYTLNSVEEGNSGSYIGQELVRYASQYIGNPYVWGGTSLTDGCDCSGFCQSIFKQFGINLPRVSEDQAQVGTAISLEDAAPGDLVFYKDETGHIYHVMIYAGEGRTVEAANPSLGIISGYVNTSEVAWCVRVLDLGADIETDGGGTEISPKESTIGGVCSYERWDRENVAVDWIAGTSQKALRDLYENYDTEGFGRIGDRYVVACTDTFGQVGDLIDFKLADGTVVKTVVGDIKDQNDPGCNEWGHQDGTNVLEFLVNGRLWGYNHANPGTEGVHPEFGQQVLSAVNYGSILD
ncbi:MAG: C40 family peptidase [Eubacterium sp.]|nr:C40 family peptidase [Eubacterium sp.]